MIIPIHLTEISTFEWSENEKSVTKPPFLEASSRRVAIFDFVYTKHQLLLICNENNEIYVANLMLQ